MIQDLFLDKESLQHSQFKCLLIFGKSGKNILKFQHLLTCPYKSKAFVSIHTWEDLKKTLYYTSFLFLNKSKIQTTTTTTTTTTYRNIILREDFNTFL